MTDLDFKVMLAKTYDPKRVQNWKEVWVEPKLDGVRVIAMVSRSGPVRYYSRNGRELGMFTHLDGSLRKLRMRLPATATTVFDCEAVGMTFGDVSGAIHTKGTVALTCRLHVFHYMPLRAFELGLDTTSQFDRNDDLQVALKAEAIKGLTVSKPARVFDHRQVLYAHDQYRAAGKEGTMVKNLQSAWTATRSWAWMKIKDEQTTEVIVTGIKEGTGKYAGNTGALICEHNGRVVRCSGMSDEQRRKFWDKPKSIIGKMIEVTYQEETEAGSLRHIRFKRVRDDKQE
jgi:ATP-dependent DNA ligase